ncbi:hypothetical protein [Streptomyces niveus]|uniref:hypothetical protein n=1 Tax=Streptomyces niveus TaxID=193462 RepID=UPI003424D4B0
MNRAEAIKFHTEEAEASDRLAALAPGTPGARQCAANAADHRSYAEAARVGDYELADLED